MPLHVTAEFQPLIKSMYRSSQCEGGVEEAADPEGKKGLKSKDRGPRYLGLEGEIAQFSEPRCFMRNLMDRSLRSLYTHTRNGCSECGTPENESYGRRKR